MFKLHLLAQRGDDILFNIGHTIFNLFRRVHHNSGTDSVLLFIW